MSSGTHNTGPVRLFCSYSHKDEKLCDELDTHLLRLKQQGVIEVWHDRKITAGTFWRDQIDSHLNEAQIILLLVSQDFLTSDYCYSVEMEQALERHERGEACVIPLIMSPVDWRGAPFSKLQALPADGKPVTSWSNRDEAWDNVARGIHKVIEELSTIKLSSSSAERNLEFVSSNASPPLENLSSEMQGERLEGTSVVPSFFQEDSEYALLAQVEWVQKKLGVSDKFFSSVLKIDEQTFSRWKTKDRVIPKYAQDHMKEFWQAILHLLSFLNYDLDKARTIIEYKTEGIEEKSGRLPFTPPWVGTSMKAYLEDNGPDGVQKVDQWVQAIRFSDSY